MSALPLAFVILNAAAFAAFILTLSVVSVQAFAGQGPTMRQGSSSWDRRITSRPFGRLASAGPRRAWSRSR